MDKQMKERIAFLLANSKLGRQYFYSYDEGPAGESNCFGTAFFILGLYDANRPIYIPTEFVSRLLPDFFIEKSTYDIGDLVIVESDVAGIVHSGIVKNKMFGKPRIVHQPFCGGEFASDSLSKFSEIQRESFSSIEYKTYSLSKEIYFPIYQNYLSHDVFDDTLSSFDETDHFIY